MVALRAQGLPAFQAAVVGAYLHGLAGELARQRVGDAGLAASELAHLLSEARRR
jgi:NAD(P)H-hydrate epimerase